MDGGPSTRAQRALHFVNDSARASGHLVPCEVNDDPARDLQVRIAPGLVTKLRQAFVLSPTIEFTRDLELRPSEVDTERTDFYLCLVTRHLVFHQQSIHAKLEDRVRGSIGVGPRLEQLAHRTDSGATAFGVECNGTSQVLAGGASGYQHPFGDTRYRVRSDCPQIEKRARGGCDPNSRKTNGRDVVTITGAMNVDTGKGAPSASVRNDDVDWFIDPGSPSAPEVCGGSMRRDPDTSECESCRQRTLVVGGREAE